MSTVTFQVPDEQAERLAEAARGQGVDMDELLRRITADYLKRASADDVAFRRALADSVRENDELLRRLAK